MSCGGRQRYQGSDRAEADAAPDGHDYGGGGDAKVANGKKDWGPTLLHAARRLAQSFGGAVPLPLLAADQQVLEIGRSLLVRQMSGTGQRLSLRKLLEDACADAPRGTGVEVRQDPCDLYPLVIAEDEEEEAEVPKTRTGSAPRTTEDDDEKSKNRLRLTPAIGDNGGGAVAAPGAVGGGGGNAWQPPQVTTTVRPVRPKRAREEDATTWQKSETRPRGGGGKRKLLGDDGAFMKLDGLELAIVCGNIPVITLEKGTAFDLNASWLLQNAMGSHSKADSLYESVSTGPLERRIVNECIRRGLATSELELWIVMARGRDDCVAVGTCGKRSMMLSLVVALALHSGDGYKLCLEELESLSLKGPFQELISTAKRMSAWDDEDSESGSDKGAAPRGG